MLSLNPNKVISIGCSCCNSGGDFSLPPADRPGTEIIKCPMFVRVCVRALVTCYKRLHISFVYEQKFTQLTQKVNVKEGMSFIIFCLILKNKMAARAVFRFFFLLFFLLFSSLLCAVDTFVHLATDANIV